MNLLWNGTGAMRKKYSQYSFLSADTVQSSAQKWLNKSDKADISLSLHLLRYLSFALTHIHTHSLVKSINQHFMQFGFEPHQMH